MEIMTITTRFLPTRNFLKKKKGKKRPNYAIWPKIYWPNSICQNKNFLRPIFNFLPKNNLKNRPRNFDHKIDQKLINFQVCQKAVVAEKSVGALEVLIRFRELLVGLTFAQFAAFHLPFWRNCRSTSKRATM